MRSKSGGEWVRTDSVRGGQTDGDHVTGEKCWRTSPAIWLKSARDFRNSKIPMHTAAATRTIAPPAFRCTSRISSVGGSQKSIVSASGPDKYDANHKRTKTLTARRFIAISLAREAARSQIRSVSTFGHWTTSKTTPLMRLPGPVKLPKYGDAVLL